MSTRRSRPRGSTAALQNLAERIVDQRVVFITGAGLSVASGIRPFRGRAQKKHTLQEGLWNDVIWTTATREAFRRNPKKWYDEFWRVYFEEAEGNYLPNAGHDALQAILEEFPNVRQITQNIDGLQPRSSQLIEAHGRIGLYKCCPDEDSDTDSDSDDDEDRPVHLGHRRKAKAATKSLDCPYQFSLSLTKDQIVSKADGVPKCPHCDNTAMPQALLFDEGYHSHSFYQFDRAEDWLAAAQTLVFCGTSFAVSLTAAGLAAARDAQIPVFNLNLHDSLHSTANLDVSNVLGPATDSLPLLLQLCRSVKEQREAKPVRKRVGAKEQRETA